MVDDDIYAQLAATSAVVDLVADRIYLSGEVPQATAMPYIAIQRISDPSEHGIDGAIVIQQARYQVSAFASTLSDARGVRDAVVGALNGYRGGSIKACTHENDWDIYEAELLLAHVPIDFLIFH